VKSKNVVHYQHVKVDLSVVEYDCSASLRWDGENKKTAHSKGKEMNERLDESKV